MLAPNIVFFAATWKFIFAERTENNTHQNIITMNEIKNNAKLALTLCILTSVAWSLEGIQSDIAIYFSDILKCSQSFLISVVLCRKMYSSFRENTQNLSTIYTRENIPICSDVA